MISTTTVVGSTPLGLLADEVAHDPVADGLDQSELLGERDELTRWNETAVGLVPANERLGAGDVPRPEVDDRLEVKHPVVVLDGASEPSG